MRDPLNSAAAANRVFRVHDYSGAVASTRVKGKEVADHLRRESEGVALTEINFSGVEVASAPFMQEIVKVARELRDRAIFSCLNEDVNATLTFVENRGRG